MKSRTFSLKSLREDRKAYIGFVKDWDISGYENVKAGPGKVVVEMHPEEDASGLILLPDDVKTQMRTDVGFVVSAGPGIPLERGEQVVVRYGHGKRVRNFHCKGFKAKSTMVFCGRVGGGMVDDPDWGDPGISAKSVAWDESIVAKVTENDITPTGRNLLIRLTSVENDGNILLSEKRHECDAEVVAVGPDCFKRKTGKGIIREMEVQPGEYVVFDDGSVTRNPTLTSVGKDLALIPDTAVLAVH